MSTWLNFRAVPYGTRDWAIAQSPRLSYDDFWMELDRREIRWDHIGGYDEVGHLYEALTGETSSAGRVKGLDYSTDEAASRLASPMWYGQHPLDPYLIALIGEEPMFNEAWWNDDYRPIRFSTAAVAAESARVIAEVAASASERPELDSLYDSLRSTIKQYAAFYAALQPGEEVVFSLT